MDNAAYASLTRQSGLRKEFEVIANNIANVATDGFRREGVIFSEFVVESAEGNASLSMARANGRIIDRGQGNLNQTGGDLDFAIEGDGFFLLETQDGPRLSRAGHFQLNAAGEIVAADGARLLDAGQAPIEVARDVVSLHLAADGTLSADGEPIADVGIFVPRDPNALSRETGVRFLSEGGIDPAPAPRLVQGFVEASNVEPVLEVARMIEVQRAYEAGKSFLDNEHQRMRDVIRTLGT